MLIETADATMAEHCSKRRRSDGFPCVVDEARAVYNSPLANARSIDASGSDRATPLIQAKASRYCACFAPRVRVNELLSAKPILPDMQAFRTRFTTVFRESGPALELAVRARLFFYSDRGGGLSYVLDLEQHSSLVTPVGKLLDGSLGVRPPRTQHLWALYEVSEGRVTSLWIAPAQPDSKGDAAVRALLGSKEWEAIDAIVRRGLGTGYSRSMGPLHSLSVGRFEMQGRRNTMEDMLSIERLPAEAFTRPADSCFHFLGLFDGHGGAACASYAAQALQLRLREAISRTPSASHFDAREAFTAAFAETEQGFLKESESTSGSCALAALVGGGKLYIANLGDSRAVLGVGAQAEAVRLTEDHKPDSLAERKRCESVGGSVVMGGRCWRITHAGTAMMLATSRSLGDRNFKESWERVAWAAMFNKVLDEEAAAESESRAAEYVLEKSNATPLLSAVPDVAERELTDEDWFIILACDGVWDVLSDQEACWCVRRSLKESPSVDAAARKLAGEAFSLGSEDNISVIVAVIRNELV